MGPSRAISICLVLLLSVSCRQAGAPRAGQPLFTEVPSEQSHINFRNDIKEDVNYNILTYEYLYNGGGVATGDLNGDGLPDLVFSGNMVPLRLYLNKGGMQFEDVTAKAGFSARSKWRTGVVMADVNGDGLLDIYVCYSGPGADAERTKELYINEGVKDGAPHFSEQAKTYGLDAPGTFTTTVAFFDMDKDGDLDMFMVNHADMFFNPDFNTDRLRATRNPKFGNRLYRNDNGVFKDISDSAHIDGSGLNFGLSVAVSDVNNDGWPDLYVTNDYDERDFLYLNNQRGGFREVLSKAAGHISEFAMGSEIADYNNDGRTDIFALDMLPEDNYRQKLLRGGNNYDKYTMRDRQGFHKQQMRNTLQLNNGNDTAGIPIFSEVGQMAGMSATDWSWSPLLADFDNDGWKDLFISDGILRDMTNLDFVKYTSGYSSDYTGKTASKEEMWELVKNMPSTKLRNYLFKNNRELGFTNVSEEWGLTHHSVSNGAAYVDLDNDGDLDLVINNLNDEATVYKNNAVERMKSGAIGGEGKDGGSEGGNAAHYLRLRLVGEGKNSYGIGAKVFIRTASGQQWQEEYTSRGFQSSVDPVMHIGLGKDSIAKLLEIRWADDKITWMEHVRGDTLLVLNEKDAVGMKGALAEVAKGINIGTGANGGIGNPTGGSEGKEGKEIGGIGMGLEAVESMAKSKTLSMTGAGGHQRTEKEERLRKGGMAPGTAGTGAGAGSGAVRYTDITAVSGIDYIHKQSGSVDFKISPLLPYQVSRVGPALAKGDVNGDGLEDLFVGGSAGFESRLYLQTGEGRFTAATEQPWNQDKDFTNTDALFFDADGDGDMDLYLVSGGADYAQGNKHYQDRLFENDGKGHFTELKDALPAETISGGCVRAADIDKDGKLDLFVGGRISPGLFPTPPESLLLKNVSAGPGHIRFEIDKTQSDAVLAHPGMVTDAAWVDLNKDGWPDLVLVGQFMPITIFENEKGKLSDRTAAYGLSDTKGWWSRLLAEDLDGDGDTDLVVGNLGTNTYFKASVKEPMSICYKDFNGDGLLDPVLCLYYQGKEYPYYSRDEILEQIPSLQKKIVRYKIYAESQMKDLFSEEDLKSAGRAEIQELRSVCLMNEGTGKWVMRPLPAYAQMSIVNGILDLAPGNGVGGKATGGEGETNGYGAAAPKGLLVAGNFYPMRAQMGPLDAGIGLILQGDGKKGFEPETYSASGLYIPGDVRGLVRVKGRKGSVIVAAKNNGPLQVIRED